MVAYLEKSEGSEGFHQTIDFLTVSHIKNALTEYPTLYASPIEQFWQTAALSTNEEGVKGITATIDRKVKVFVSKASIRRHLKLEDSEGLKTLPTVEIFEQLALIGYEAAPMTHESPFQSVHSLGRDEGSLSLHELTDLCTSLSKKGRSLIKELDLDAGISLVPPHAADQGKIDDTQISDQPEEQLGVFSAATSLADVTRRRQSVESVQTYTRRRREVSTGSGGVSTANRLVSTADISTASELDSIAGVKAKGKGKAIMHDYQAHDIDWSDLAVLRYHTLQNRPFSVAEVRKNMCLYLNNQESSKPVEEEIVQQEDVITEQAVKESSRTAGGRRKKSLARKRAKETLNEESAKKQKLEDDTEKEELQVYMNIVPEVSNSDSMLRKSQY
ncbi:hypothetical protein Tco_0290325 [Tanacetum coccineum]